MHPGAWVAWVLMVMTIALVTTNPFYLCLLLLSVLVVAAFAPRSSTGVLSFRVLFIGGILLLSFSVLVATVNGGIGEKVLFSVPGPELPSWLGGLRFGGPVTAESLVAALVRGLAILCVFLGFAVFNGAVSPHRVLRMGPAALFHAGLVLTVGLTLLPSTLQDLRRLREMRALRGGGSGVRHIPALVVPAVIGGLERALRLAEAMEARGYAAPPPLPVRARLAGFVAVPLALVAGWMWLYAPSLALPAAGLALLSVASLAWWGFETSRARRTTRMRPEPFTPIDIAGVAFAMTIAFGALVARTAGWVDLTYNPFAALPVPSLQITGMLLAIAPLWIVPRLFVSPLPRATSPSPELTPSTEATGR
jgi:energy-coupling factor transport system permease protein